MAGVTFTASAAAKIQKAVRIVFNTPVDRNGERTRAHSTDTYFWGMVLSSDITGKRFHFVKVYPDASADAADFHLSNGQAFVIAETEAETGFAREANANPGVPPYTVALMQFVGYDADGEPAYLFQCSIGTPQDYTLPPHDHRDNYNGGFSFAVFHPGTALPQQPWSM